MTATHPHNYAIIQVNRDSFTLDMLRMLYSEDFDGEKIYAIDIETAKHPDYVLDPKAGLCPHRSKIRLIQIAQDENCESFVFDMFNLEDLQKQVLFNFISNNEFFAHFAQFEASHFQHNGLEFPKLHCTMVMYRMFLRAQYAYPGEYAASLQAVVKRLLKIDISKAAQLSDWGAPELTDEQIIYAARDASYTIIIGRALLNKVRTMMPRAYLINQLSVNPLARMALNGIYFNKTAHKKVIAAWQVDSDKAHRKCKKAFGDINFNSGVQLGKMLEENFKPSFLKGWPLTEKGRYKTDQATLSAFKDVDGIKELCAYKKSQKLISTYGKSLVANISKATGRIHCSYSLGYTTTGRLSSFNPNLQNLPRGDEVRSKFKHQYKTTCLVGADFSQIESKIAALVSGDQVMLDVFRSGGDIYKTTAALVLGKHVSEVTKEERQLGKSLALGLLFGMGATTYRIYAKVNFGVELTQRQAERAVAKFHAAFPQYREWQLGQAEGAEDTLMGYTRSGMIRKLDDKNYYTCSMNTPIQGSAAEIILASLIRIDRHIQEKKIPAMLVNCVHDEILIECKRTCGKELATALKRCMVRGFHDVFPDTMGIKEFVDVGIGNNWAEVH